MLLHKEEGFPASLHNYFFKYNYGLTDCFFKVQCVIVYYRHYSFCCSKFPGLASGSPSSFWHASLAFEHNTTFYPHLILTLHWTLNLPYSPKRHCRILNYILANLSGIPTKSGAMWLSWERTTYRRPTKARKREMSHKISGLPIWVGFLHL